MVDSVPCLQSQLGWGLRDGDAWPCWHLMWKDLFLRLPAGVSVRFVSLLSRGRDDLRMVGSLPCLQSLLG